MDVAARKVVTGSVEPPFSMGSRITAEYLALQKELHSRTEYGVGENAQLCAAAVKSCLPDGGTVLDYGSGPGVFKGVLGPGFEVEEYDPCIDGKDEEPAAADVVVCADVLEHIEPDCLDTVLLHIRALTRKYAVLVISTRMSGKTMANGRNAHLIVEEQGFWFQRLTGLFDFERFEDGGDILFILATPRPLPKDVMLPIGRIRATAAVEDDVRNDNVRINCKKTDKRLDVAVTPHERVAHVVAYGPTLKSTWPELAIAQAKGEEIFSMSGSHAFLLEHGIIPTAHLDCDPRAHKVAMLGEPDRRVAYWLASCVHPSYLDKLEGHDVSLWHSYNGKASREAFKIDPGQRMVVGGGSIGLRAMSVLYLRGFRKFEIHGMDCCFIEDEHHAGAHLGKNNAAIPVICGARTFKANAVMLLYARFFRKQMKMMSDAAVNLHGDGLLQHMIRQENE